MSGSNAGTAILGHDFIKNPSWSGSTNGSWAGYFSGDLHVSDSVGIGTETPLSKLHINQGQ